MALPDNAIAPIAPPTASADAITPPRRAIVGRARFMMPFSGELQLRV